MGAGPEVLEINSAAEMENASRIRKDPRVSGANVSCGGSVSLEMMNKLVPFFKRNFVSRGKM